jgi:hypothetical protein
MNYPVSDDINLVCAWQNLGLSCGQHTQEELYPLMIVGDVAFQIAPGLAKIKRDECRALAYALNRTLH